jgi:molybdate transport system substrate-binding protein
MSDCFQRWQVADQIGSRANGQRLSAVGLTLALAATACGNGTTDVAVRVFAASSLTDCFHDIEHEYAHPGRRVELSFGASSQLAIQIVNGAPASVFASADEPNMKKVADAKLTARAAQPMGTAWITVIVAKGDPLRIANLPDLAKDGVRVALAGPEVPVGRVSRDVLAAASVNIHPISNEQNARGVVSRVQLGEADAGLVWSTDAHTVGQKLDVIALPRHNNIGQTTYQIAPMRTDGNHQSQQFVDFVRSAAGQRTLRNCGVGPA